MSHILLELNRIDQWVEAHAVTLSTETAKALKELLLTGTPIDLRTIENSAPERPIAY